MKFATIILSRSFIILLFFLSTPFHLKSQNAKSDIAFVLRGYDGSCFFCDTTSFKVHAKIIVDYLKILSFGRIKTYKILMNGTDSRSPIFLQSLRDIETLQAALDGWPGAKWDWLRTRTDFWYIVPESYRPIVTRAIQWLKDNKKDFAAYAAAAPDGKANADALQVNITRMGSSAAADFLLGMSMPQGFNPEDYMTTLVILNSAGPNSIAGGGAAWVYSQWGILNAQGQAYPNTGKQYPVAYIGANSLTSGFYYTAIHEAVHTFGMGTHDVDPNLLAIDYSVMKGGEINCYSTLPAWDRYYWTHWLPQSTITTNQSEVVDLKTHTSLSDTSQKFIFQVKAGDVQGRGGTYKELYEGKWYAYTLDAGGTLTFIDKLDVIHYAPIDYIAVIPESIKEGAPATFIVYNDGEQPWKYQWRKNGVNIPGAITNSYFINKATLQDGGKYSIVISNLVGSVTTKEINVSIEMTSTPLVNLKSNESITIRPNPAREYFYFDFQLNETKSVDVDIIQAASGLIVNSMRSIASNQLINTSLLMPGMYFIKIRRKDTNQFYLQKLIKY